MQKAIIGKKAGMTQIWDDSDRALPVTVIEVQPCRVVCRKTIETDGYSAIQVTAGETKISRINKPQLGHFEAAGVEPGELLVELRLEDTEQYEPGTEFGVEVFEPGDIVDVTSVSKGKGFAGVMKRHGFAGSPASHGAHKVHRKPGAVGQCATPSRILKGRKMPGRMGGRKVTTLNLKVAGVDLNEGLIMVNGSVPGPKGAAVIVRNAVKVPLSTGIKAAGN